MTKKQWEKLIQERPDLNLTAWDFLGCGEREGAKKMTCEDVIAQVTSSCLIGHIHPFTWDVPF